MPYSIHLVGYIYAIQFGLIPLLAIHYVFSVFLEVTA